jgi:hypothetical protein
MRNLVEPTERSAMDGVVPLPNGPAIGEYATRASRKTAIL